MPRSTRKSPAHALAWLGLAALSLLACQFVSPRAAATPGAATPLPRTPATRGAATTAAAATPTSSNNPNTSASTPVRRSFSVGPAALSFLAAAQPANGLRLDESQLPFLALFPELHDAPAPDWLQTGARVTYRLASATIPQVQGQTSTSGAGYVQYDLVALDSGLAVATSKLYLDSSDGAGVLPSLVFPVLGLPGVGEFWLNPQPLVNAEQVATAELSVARMDQSFAGDNYHALRFEYTHGNAQYAWMFDTDTGVLLFYSWSIGGDADPNRQLGQMTLAARRQLALPWQAGSLPAWVAQTRSLHYSGSYATTVSGAATVSLPGSAEVTLQDHFAHWNAYSLSASIQGQAPSTAERLTGGDEIFDGLWLPPEALAALQDGQTLDTDGVTGAVIAVARDQNTVTLTESGRLYQTSLTYDGSDGRLLESMQQEQIGLATTVTTLKLEGAS
jgi:hypothetical protein